MQNDQSTNGSAATPFHVALRRARETAKDTRSGVADVIHVSKDTVAVWENGGSPPGVAKYAALCDLYPELRKASAPRPFRKRTTPQARPQPEATSGLRQAVLFVRRAKAGAWRPNLLAFLRDADAAGLAVRDVIDLIK